MNVRHIRRTLKTTYNINLVNFLDCKKVLNIFCVALSELKLFRCYCGPGALPRAVLLRPAGACPLQMRRGLKFEINNIYHSYQKSEGL